MQNRVINVRFDTFVPNLVGGARLNDPHRRGVVKIRVCFVRRLPDGDWKPHWHTGSIASRRRAMRVAPLAQLNL